MNSPSSKQADPPSARQRAAVQRDGASKVIARAARDAGEAIILDVNHIDEDPNQPRKQFEEGAMVELTESIKLHGVKVPIAVHRHPTIPGRYVIDDGARRYRCSIRAGKRTVPAVVGKRFSLIEQLVVNKVRDDTPARDKATAFARLMKEKGWTQRELSERSKLSEAYVSQHLTLLKLPATIDALFTTGRCSDVTVINELVKAHRKDSDAVEAWLGQADQEITRESVRRLRNFLGRKDLMVDEPEDLVLAVPNAQVAVSNVNTGKNGLLHPTVDRMSKAVAVLGIYKKRPVRLLLNKRWSAEGLGWVKFEDNGEEMEVEVGQVKLNRLVEI